MFKFFSSIPDTAAADALFAEAYACIEQGLCYDEVNDYKNTLDMYERGLNLISEGLKQKHAKKAELFGAMMEAKPSVEHRVKVLKLEGPNQPSGSNEVVIPAKEAAQKEEEMKSSIRDQLDHVGSEEADLIFFIPEGVQLFMIDGDETTAPTYPTSLQILKFNPKDDDSFAYEMDHPFAFIQVGPWVYPLMKEKTPILKNEYGGYVVHNPTPEHPNMMVAILLPSDVEARIHDEFQLILSEYAVIREQEVKKELTLEENSRISRKLAEFLISGGEKIAWGVQTVTVKVASKVEDRGEKYRCNLAQTEAPLNINPAIKGSVLYMHKGSKVVAKCTRFILDKIGDMGIAIGQKVATGAQKTFGGGKTGGLVSGTITVIGGGIAGASTVWMALEDGSKTMCKAIANQTVQNVKVKYGDDASETTHHALYAAGHGGLAAAQIWELGPRSIAGRVAKKAGIQMVSDLHRKQTGEALPIKDKKMPPSS